MTAPLEVTGAFIAAASQPRRAARQRTDADVDAFLRWVHDHDRGSRNRPATDEDDLWVRSRP